MKRPGKSSKLKTKLFLCSIYHSKYHVYNDNSVKNKKGTISDLFFLGGIVQARDRSAGIKSRGLTGLTGLIKMLSNGAF